MTTRMKIVPLLHTGGKGGNDSIAQWKLIHNGEEIGRYASIYEAHIAAEQLFGIMRWIYDPTTSGYTAME